MRSSTHHTSRLGHRTPSAAANYAALRVVEVCALLSLAAARPIGAGEALAQCVRPADTDDFADAAGEWDGRRHSELPGRDLEARHAGIAPHLHDAGAVIEDGRQSLELRGLDLGQPFGLDHHVVAVVAGLAHAEAFRRTEGPRPQHVSRESEATVPLQPFDGLRLAFVAAAGPNPDFGAGLAQGLQRADDRNVRRVVLAGRKEAAPVLRGLLDVVQTVFDQRQRAVEVEDVKGLHSGPRRRFKFGRMRDVVRDPVESGLHSISQPRREHWRPLRHSRWRDSYRCGCTCDGAAEQLDSVVFVHAAHLRSLTAFAQAP